MSENERSQLTSIARSRSIPAAIVTRARIVLAAAAGEPDSGIALRLQLTRATAHKHSCRSAFSYRHVSVCRFDYADQRWNALIASVPELQSERQISVHACVLRRGAGRLYSFHHGRNFGNGKPKYHTAELMAHYNVSKRTDFSLQVVYQKVVGTRRVRCSTAPAFRGLRCFI